MNKELAEKIYIFILQRMNGWTEEQVEELDSQEIYSDPIFEELCKLDDEGDSELCEAELKGRQEVKNESREFLINLINNYTELKKDRLIILDKFDAKFGDKK